MTLHIHTSSIGLEPAALRPGEDLVLHAPPEHGASLPEGTLVEDHLDASALEAVDERAAAALARWRSEHEADLVDCGISLADIWEGELFQEVFLELERALAGITAGARAMDVSRIASADADADLMAAVAEALGDGIEVEAPAHAPPPPSYPSLEAAPLHLLESRTLMQRVARGTLDAFGLPSVPRGDVVVIPYHSTGPVIEDLAAGHGLAPALLAASPPPPATALAALRRGGGWIGLPGTVARVRARRRTLARLNRLARIRQETAAGVLRHSRALRCLAHRGAETPATVAVTARAMRRGSFGAVLVPYDAEVVARVLVRVAQRAGVPVIALQHGYEPLHLLTRVGMAADLVGAWDEVSRDAFPPAHRGRVRVIGNPAAPAAPVARKPPPTGRAPRAVVLVEGAARGTARVSRRAAARHLRAALDGLGGWDVVVRPHPAYDPLMLEPLLADVGHAGTRYDATSPIAALLDWADVCVGAMSTVALQTAAYGVPLVMLDVTGVPLRAPLDGSGGVLRVTDADGVVTATAEALRAPELPGGAALLDALGAGRDAATAVLGWIEDTAAQRRASTIT